MENSINQRIRQIISYYKISDKDFAESIGVPIEVISRMLGHSDIRTTQIYAKVQRSMVEEQGKIIAQKLAL